MITREEVILGLKDIKEAKIIPPYIEEPMGIEGVTVNTDEMFDLAIKALEERRTGHWIKNAPPWDCQNPPFICSECGNPHLLFETPYCEICGADMRGGV